MHAPVADLYDRFGPALYRVALTLLADAAAAEDAVQDVFLGYLRARPAADDVRAYLFASLYRAAAKHRAKSIRERPVPPDELGTVAAPDAGPPAFDRSARLEAALRSLPPDQRAVIALKIDGDLTFAEVAGIVGVSANTAASRYRYALEKLRAALGDADRD